MNDSKKIFTVAELAEHLGVTDAGARGLVVYLLEVEVFEDRGVRRVEKGRSPRVFSIKDLTKAKDLSYSLKEWA